MGRILWIVTIVSLVVVALEASQYSEKDLLNLLLKAAQQKSKVAPKTHRRAVGTLHGVTEDECHAFAQGTPDATVTYDAENTECTIRTPPPVYYLPPPVSLKASQRSEKDLLNLLLKAAQQTTTVAPKTHKRAIGILHGVTEEECHVFAQGTPDATVTYDAESIECTIWTPPPVYYLPPPALKKALYKAFTRVRQ